MFLAAIGPNISATADRLDFLGRNSDWRRPAGLRSKALSTRFGSGLDSAGVVQTQFSLKAGEQTEIAFLLGCGDDAVVARRLAHRYSTLKHVHQAVVQAMSSWNSILGSLQVKTPNRALDLLINRWLVYQVLSCRLWGRSAFYQSGGAYGFRDQLQDVMALLYSRPDLAREHILRAAARQYEDGGAQHWWHPPDGVGTRTRFSDDFLWLPFVVAHYLTVTQDFGLLDEVIPFLHSQPLLPEEQERYELPQISAEKGSLYEHCLRALTHGVRRGEHGLPLMGCGDWNDGMNKIGELGQGESVWVGWFLLVILRDFLPVMRERGDHSEADELAAKAATLRQAIEAHAWDGEWYRRAFFDDGTPLGSARNDECRIDSIAQSWAVIAKADPQRTDQALASVFEHLVSMDDKLVKLLDPPFDKTRLEPGYIKGYLPGVRENGGQYTHAVMWFIQALALKGDGDRAMQIFDAVNPVSHTSDPQSLSIYRSEPYVVAADVYSIPPHVGRGGWTWYTGSASWMYRVAVETLLGLKLRGRQLSFAPCLPQNWDGFELSLRFGVSLWRFKIRMTADASGDDGRPIELYDDGQTHDYVLHLPCRSATKAHTSTKLPALAVPLNGHGWDATRRTDDSAESPNSLTSQAQES